MLNERIVIYTAITGRKDLLHEPRHRMPGVDYICFTDAAHLRSNIFSLRPLPFGQNSPRLTARQIKLFPNLLFPDHTVSLWIDGHKQIVRDLTPVFETGLNGFDIACMDHPARRCLYMEAEICAKLGRDNLEIIARQSESYRIEGMPVDSGLSETSVMLRRHHSPAVKAAMEAWWRELTHYSVRDQISFPYVVWKQQLLLNRLDYRHWHDRYFLQYDHCWHPEGDNRNKVLVRLKTYIWHWAKKLQSFMP